MSNADPLPHESTPSRRETEQTPRASVPKPRGTTAAPDGAAERPSALIERLEATARSARAAAEQLDERLRLAARMLKCFDRLMEQGPARLPPPSAATASPPVESGAAPDEAGAAALERAESIVRIAEDAERNVALMLHRAAELLQEMHGMAAGAETTGDEPARGNAPASTAAPADGVTTEPAPHRDADSGQAAANALPGDDDELMQMNRELQSQLGAMQEQYDRLVALQSILDPSEDLTTRVLATVSEEIHTPVETIARLLELLAETGLDTTQRSYLADARVAIRSLQELMGSVPCPFDAPDETSDALVERLDLRLLVDDLVRVLTPVAERKGVRIRPVVESDEAELWGEHGRLRHALLYALTRAVQCAARGEVVFTVCAARRPGRTVAARFAIVGTGAPPHAWRAGNAPSLVGTAGSASGIDSPQPGLGLTIARRLVELMGGELGLAAVDEERFEIFLTADLSGDSPEGGAYDAYPRLPQEDLESNLGRVLDLSVSGMRIACARVPPENDLLDVELKDPDGAVHLKAQVVWSRRLGFRRHEAGLRFIDVTRERAADLTRVSLNHRVPTNLAPRRAESPEAP